jgi:hypothetical protein
MSWGALWMKHLRLGDPAALPQLFTAWLGVVQWANVVRFRRPNGLGTFAAFASGMLASFKHPIDRASRSYVAPSLIGFGSDGWDADRPAPT